MVTLVDKILDIKSQIESPDDMVKANELVISIFRDIKGEHHEEKDLLFYGPPRMVAEFVRNLKLPNQGDTYLFAVATYGGNVGSVIAQIGELLKQRIWKLHYGDTVWSYPNAVTLYPMI